MHLDRVQGLGDFMELEVVLADDEPPQSAAACGQRHQDVGIPGAVQAQ